MVNSKIKEYLEQDEAKIQKLIEENPVSVTPAVVAEVLGVQVQSVRAMLDNNRLGLSWRKDGKLNKGYLISTPKFVRWYLNIDA